MSAPSLRSPHRIRSLPILVLLPHNRCNCRCLMCDIWKIREVREITERDLEPHRASLRELQVKWVVFSGGEPLLHSDIGSLSRVFRAEGIRITLLTAGLTLEKCAAIVAAEMDDVIVSLDGPAAVHDRIRSVPGAYRRLQNGIQALRQLRPAMPIQGRCTIQKTNFDQLRHTVRAARALSLDSLSFLAVDTTSTAFNRAAGSSPEPGAGVGLDAAEVEALECEIEALIRDFGNDIETGFVVEKPDKLRRIWRHFRARLGQVPPSAPRCNAPWVSAVVESDGTVRPCFFHRPIGNIHASTLSEVLNGDDALAFRSQLDVAQDPVCRSCVCSLFLSSRLA